MISGEQLSNKGKRESSIKAKELGSNVIHGCFYEASGNEARHARVFEGIP